MLRAASRNTAGRSAASVARKVAVPALVQRRGFMSSLDDYGSNLFKGKVADTYLAKQGLPAGLMDDPKWTSKPATADKVAAAIMEWAGDRGASVYTHWFQPTGSAGVRLGMTGQVHNTFFAFGADGKPEFEFKGKTLLKGETDGSSFPNGGIRATHCAGGYTVLDPTSPIFLRLTAYLNAVGS
jgi:glutamine synthetase